MTTNANGPHKEGRPTSATSVGITDAGAMKAAPQVVALRSIQAQAQLALTDVISRQEARGETPAEVAATVRSIANALAAAIAATPDVILPLVGMGGEA